MLNALLVFVRSFYSRNLYDEVASEGGHLDAFSYLLAISFYWSVLCLVLAIILSLFLSGVALYAEKLPALPATVYVSGTAFLVLQLIFRFIIGLVIALINAVVFALVISLLSYVAAIPGKLFSVLLLARLNYYSIRQIAAFSYLPAAIIFWSLAGWLALNGKFEYMAGLIKTAHNLLAEHLVDLPYFMTIIAVEFIVLMLPLPVWLAYIIYGIICTKLYFIGMHKPSDRLR